MSEQFGSFHEAPGSASSSKPGSKNPSAPMTPIRNPATTTSSATSSSPSATVPPPQLPSLQSSSSSNAGATSTLNPFLSAQLKKNQQQQQQQLHFSSAENSDSDDADDNSNDGKEDKKKKNEKMNYHDDDDDETELFNKMGATRPDLDISAATQKELHRHNAQTSSCSSSSSSSSKPTTTATVIEITPPPTPSSSSKIRKEQQQQQQQEQNRGGKNSKKKEIKEENELEEGAAGRGGVVLAVMGNDKEILDIIPEEEEEEGEGEEKERKVEKSDFEQAAESEVRIDRPFDVALEYNRRMLHRYAALLAICALPLLYLTPVVGILLCPSGALVAYWSAQKTRFQHGGDVRACVNRDCSIVVGIVFISIALCLDGFNVLDLAFGGQESSSKIGGSSSTTAGGKKTIVKITTTTTKSPASASSPNNNNNHFLHPSSSSSLLNAIATTITTHFGLFDPVDHDNPTLAPSQYYAHKHEAASHSPGLRKAEIVCGCIVFLPAVVTLRHLLRIRSLVINPDGAIEGD